MWQTEHPKYMAVAGILLEEKALDAMVEKMHSSFGDLVRKGSHD
jgi:hypothetical protein